jgi:hypothetical protein
MNWRWACSLFCSPFMWFVCFSIISCPFIFIFFLFCFSLNFFLCLCPLSEAFCHRLQIYYCTVWRAQCYMCMLLFTYFDVSSGSVYEGTTDGSNAFSHIKVFFPPPCGLVCSW